MLLFIFAGQIFSAASMRRFCKRKRHNMTFTEKYTILFQQLTKAPWTMQARTTLSMLAGAHLELQKFCNFFYLLLSDTKNCLIFAPQSTSPALLKKGEINQGD